MRNNHIDNFPISLDEFEELAFAEDEDIAYIIETNNLLESEILYFSAGESKVKEVLIKREPSVSI